MASSGQRRIAVLVWVGLAVAVAFGVAIPAVYFYKNPVPLSEIRKTLHVP
jgi:hypothetical protein